MYSSKNESNNSIELALHHIGVVIPKIVDAAKTFEELGLVIRTDPVPDPIQKVSASFVRVDCRNETYIELLEPTDITSPVAKFLTSRGGGLHHLCFEVDDIEAVVIKMQRKGYRMVCPPVECIGYDRNFKRNPVKPSRIAFFLLPNRLLIELLQPG